VSILARSKKFVSILARSKKIVSILARSKKIVSILARSKKFVSILLPPCGCDCDVRCKLALLIRGSFQPEISISAHFSYSI
jgi:hypothetical protein